MKIAVLGLGIIGSAWASNLIADHHEVRCWNRTPKEDFPHFQASLPAAVDGAEAIFLVVADPPAVQSVLDGILPKLGPSQLLIQCSTISARWTLEFARQVQATGARFLEAPFTGSKQAAKERKTVYYLGGEEALVARARPILEPIASALLHIGPLGTASSLKLAMNMNIAGIAQTLCESLSLCRAAGIADDVYFEALSRNVAHSPLVDLKAPKLRAADYSPQFALKHMDKDLRLALETAAGFSLPLAQTERLKQSYEEGRAAGWQEDDFIGLLRLLTKARGNEGPQEVREAMTNDREGRGLAAHAEFQRRGAEDTETGGKEGRRRKAEGDEGKRERGTAGPSCLAASCLLLSRSLLSPRLPCLLWQDAACPARPRAFHSRRCSLVISSLVSNRLSGSLHADLLAPPPGPGRRGLASRG